MGMLFLVQINHYVKTLSALFLDVVLLFMHLVLHLVIQSAREQGITALHNDGKVNP